MQYFLTNIGTRPDFRLVVEFIWGEGHNCKTDGNARHPASREWTDLWIRSREVDASVVEVEPVSEDPLVLVVSSESPDLAARMALFLQEECGCLVQSDSENGPLVPASELASATGVFNVAKAWEASKASRWRRATEEDPYPEP